MSFIKTFLFFIGFLYPMINSSVESCIEKERQSLLELKRVLDDPTGRLAPWVGDDPHCCRWKGVVCDNVTNHIIQLHLGGQYDSIKETGSRLGGNISPSLLQLKHLSYLDLSNNDFTPSRIPNFFGSMRSLRHLSLSEAGFFGELPQNLGNLSNLEYLNLHSSFSLQAETLHWLSGIPLLEHLDLGGVELSKVSNWFQVVNTLPSLKKLYLPNCQLQNPLEHPIVASANLSSLNTLDLASNDFKNSSVIDWIFSLENLIFLDLSYNHFTGALPYGLRNLTALEHLYLVGNAFNSSIPDWFSRFRAIQYLNLGYNDLHGNIPKSFANLCNLRILSLSNVSLSQEISQVLEMLSHCAADSLEELWLENCQLFGQLTNKLGNFKKLKFLFLENNFITGPLPNSLGELSSLAWLHLQNNQLNGSLPESFGRLESLVEFDIRRNSFEGFVSENHFLNLTKLETFLGGAGNSLTMEVNPNWVPRFQIQELALGGWHLGPQFPPWLRLQKSLRWLDISDSAITDAIPIWFFSIFSDDQLTCLNISHNQMHGQIPHLPSTFEFSIIDFSFNNFSGPLPPISTNLSYLDLSNNHFSDGNISRSLCSAATATTPTPSTEGDYIKMTILNLGENNLSGELPDCWTGWSLFKVLILANNKFSGGIPDSIGSLQFLQSMHLQKNRLSGEINPSLRNCTSLATLDLGENEFDGHIPPWIGQQLSGLKILRLHSNKFQGHIPDELCALNSLQILDLARNNISGVLPRCISNLTAMASGGNDSSDNFFTYDFWIAEITVSFLDNLLVLMKGEMLEYSKTLRLVRIMDFSDNNLSGEIPQTITSLLKLQSLNLSHNFLSGRIPGDIGDMRWLESLDLSANKLSGLIPDSVSSLSFLSYLNLSNNQLTGRIPTTTQLQTFNASSFSGNKLCGLPLGNSCSVSPNGPTPMIPNGENKRDGNHVNWFLVSVAFGFIVGFWSVISPLVISRRWRNAYYKFLEEIWWKIYDNVMKCF